MMNNLLFVYGTLLQPDNEFAVYLNKNCSFISYGKIKGQLYDIGEYPGLVMDYNADHYVHGSIFKMNDPAAVLKQTDYYEGFGSDEEQPNLYIRQMGTIQTDKDQVEAWVYLYNRPVDGYKMIPSGDYAEYIRQKKSPGY